MLVWAFLDFCDALVANLEIVVFMLLWISTPYITPLRIIR